MKLHTPLGNIKIYVDDIEVEYIYREVPLDRTCPNLNGRYAVEITINLDGIHHTIGCFIDKYTPFCEVGVEPGEYLEIKSFLFWWNKVVFGGGR